MSVNQPAPHSTDIVGDVPRIETSASRRILFNLPEDLQTVQVLRALICAEYEGHRRGWSECLRSGLASVRLSSGRPS